MARPPKWTDEQRTEALARILSGENVSEVSRAMGIPRATLQLWRDAIEPAVRAAIPVSGAVSGSVNNPPALADRAPELGQRVLEEICAIGFGNLSDVIQWDERGNVTFTPSDELTPAQAAIVSEVRVKRRREVNGKGEDAVVWEVEEAGIKTRNKLGALDTLAKITGILAVGGVTFNDNRDQRQQTMNHYELPAGLSVDELRKLAEMEDDDGDE